MNFDNAKKNLETLGYEVLIFDNKEQAADELDRRIDGTTVGFGGSQTLDDLGLFERLSTHNTVSWHWRIPQGLTDREVRMQEREASIYLSSANGLAETGEIVNIDGNGNRVADVQYGHDHVYLVMGENKLAPNFEQALWRARNIAAPKNAQRLGSKTPCAVNGDHCYDCKSPGRICRGLSVLWNKPTASGCLYTVVLVRESLGF